MQETKTTCDRCAVTTEDAGLDWNSLYAGEDIDLCPSCCKALIVWVGEGAEVGEGGDA